MAPGIATAAAVPVAPVQSRWRTSLLAIAVAIAFADSSIVVLALPEIFAEFETSIIGISFVLTGYTWRSPSARSPR